MECQWLGISGRKVSSFWGVETVALKSHADGTDVDGTQCQGWIPGPTERIREEEKVPGQDEGCWRAAALGQVGIMDRGRSCEPSGLGWWCLPTIGHDDADSRVVRQAPATGERCSTQEGSSKGCINREIRQQMISYISEIQARRLKELSQDVRDLPPGDESDDEIPGRDAEELSSSESVRRQQRLRQQLEEKWSFPFIPGRRAEPGAINIECMRAIIQIFKLDDSLREEVEHLRDAMCDIVKVSSFQHGLDFESPAFPLILRDVSCQRCCEASHVDVTSHPTRGPGLWVCTRCDQTYDKDAMQARLVDLLHSIIQAWQSQEVICKKCRGLRLAQMQQFCECFGRYEASFKSSDFQQLMQVLRSLTEPLSDSVPVVANCASGGIGSSVDLKF
eukprot:s34_g17.t1